MQDQIIILKNTKNGIVKDTIMSIQDTIYLNLENLVKLQQPDENLVVKTITEPLSTIEVVGIWVGVILAVVTIAYTFIAIHKLLTNDKQLQSQIDELVNLNHLFERRLRMSVKPRLWSNGNMYSGADNMVQIRINNRGELALYKGFETLEGEDVFTLQEWDGKIPIEKDKEIKLSGRTNIHPKDANFKIKILYSDLEDYNYETIIEWDKGKVKFLETIEL